ncbi:MAG: L-threonylcarbamoyladenylate synthase [Verrucomicrobiota bacterium]
MAESVNMPAVFLDRDGTIIEDRGYLRSPSEVVFFSDTVPALTRLQEHYRLFIVTHQSGIAKGIVRASEVDQVNGYVVSELRRRGVIINEVYSCPHNREDLCACIKPNPHFLEKAAGKYNVDLTASFVVGDHPHDVKLAENAGAEGIYVLTGHGIKHRPEIPEHKAIVSGIREAVDWIFATRRMNLEKVGRPGLLEKAAGILRSGGIVAFPTETVYGLGAIAFDTDAVARVFEVKQRPHFDPLIVHISGPEQLSEVAGERPEGLEALIERFWPGPLTLALPKAAAVPDLVTAGLSTVAVRMPGHPMALDLIDRTGMPVAAPSANPFGYVSPTKAEHVASHIGESVDMILDCGPCTVGVESTVLSLAGPRPEILRAGGIAAEDIESVMGRKLQYGAGITDHVSAPGQTPSHYSPRTPIVLACCDVDIPRGARTGHLRFGNSSSAGDFVAVEDLSRKGSMREAAINLFAALHRLDALDLDLIVADTVPETGLGAAIMDRLRRASRKRQ